MALPLLNATILRPTRRPSSSFLAKAPIGPASRKRVTVVWTPNPGPQVAFLACPNDRVLYGGKLGGGKTDALLADYLGQVHLAGYNGLFIRRSYPELLQVIRRSQRIYPAFGGKYNKTEKLWTFPSGATLRFGFVTSYEDALRYASDEYQWIGIDECTHVPFEAFELLTTRLRGADELGLKCYVRLSANPNGRHMLWVRQLFIEGKAPLTTYHDDETGISSCFIPADMAPQLLGTGYDKRLLGLGEKERKALLGGDWYAYEGSVFTLEPGIHTWTWQQFRERTGLDAIPAEWTRFRTLDWGYAKPFACYWYAVDYEGRAYVYREWYGAASDGKGGVQANVGARLEPEKVAEKIASIERESGERIATGWAGPDLWNGGRGDYGGARKLVEPFTAAGVMWQPWDARPGSRLAGKTSLHQRLAYSRDAEGGVSEWPGIVFIAEETPNAQRTLPALEYDKHQPELVDTDGEDHAYDSLSGFTKMRPWAPTPAKDERSLFRRQGDRRKAGSWQGQ